VADGDAVKPYLAERFERLTGGPDEREQSFAIRQRLWREIGMSLEALRALPWHEADAIMEQLLSLEGEGARTQLEATGENLSGLGFTYEQD
jgi:hypothetical protein